MKAALVFLLPLLCGAAAPGDVDALIRSARGAGCEFAADAMIRIASLDQIPKARKIELLEEAFQKAGDAQQQFKRRPVFTRLDGPAGFLMRAYDQNLDALSLRMRVVEAMLPLDSSRARALLLSVPAIRPPRLSCADFMAYDLGRFYDVLQKVAEQADARDRFGILSRYAGAIASPLQVEPLARVIAASGVSDGDFAALVGSFSKALGALNGDDRSFAASYNAGSQIEALVAECKRRRVPPEPVVQSYRSYLMIHFSGTRCADDGQMQGGGAALGLSGGIAQPDQTGIVAFFNQKLRLPGTEPLGELDVTPSRLEGEAAGTNSCQGEQCRSILDQQRAVMMKGDGSLFTPAEQATPEWQGKLGKLLDTMGAWSAVKEAGPEEVFREKASAYRALLGVVSGAGRERVFRAMLEFLQGNPFAAVNRIEWFLPVNGLIGRTALDPVGFAKMAETLRNSTDPVIALYAKLEALAPRDAGQIMRLQ